LRISDCGLPIADFGLKDTPNEIQIATLNSRRSEMLRFTKPLFESAIRNPQSQC